MRKQYYFRPSERGLLAWDVDRLVVRTKHFPRSRIPLTSIRELDEPFCSEHEGALTWRSVIEHVLDTSGGFELSHHSFGQRARHGWHASCSQGGVVGASHDRGGSVW